MYFRLTTVAQLLQQSQFDIPNEEVPKIPKHISKIFVETVEMAAEQQIWGP